MQRLLLIAALAMATAPAWALGKLPTMAGANAATAPSASSLPPNFGRVTSSLTVALPGFGKGSAPISRTRTLPGMGNYGFATSNTGAGGDFTLQFSHQSKKAIAAGDTVPSAAPATKTGPGLFPPLAIDYQRTGGGYGSGPHLFQQTEGFPGVGAAVVTLSNDGAEGRSDIGISYSTH